MELSGYGITYETKMISVLQSELPARRTGDEAMRPGVKLSDEKSREQRITDEIVCRLLMEFDKTLRLYYRENLGDVVAHLRTLYDRQEERSAATILHVVHKSGILYEKDDAAVIWLRDAIQRFVEGTYGICSICGGIIQTGLLVEIPTANVCLDCQDRTVGSAWKK
jgi:RNA polymerase-binding transcription factor DksA